MSDGGRLHKPGTPTANQDRAHEEPRHSGSSVDTDRAWAQSRIANFLRGQNVMRKATSDAAGHADEGPGRKVSQPGEPAEQEADAVADHVADKLHSDSDKAGADHTTKEAAPQIGAKRAAGTISLAKKDDKKPDDKKPQKDMTLLGAKGTQCTSKTMWKGKGKERIDVENPNPGQRAGQIHYQDNDDNSISTTRRRRPSRARPKPSTRSSAIHNSQPASRRRWRCWVRNREDQSTHGRTTARPTSDRRSGEAQRLAFGWSG